MKHSLFIRAALVGTFLLLGSAVASAASLPDLTVYSVNCTPAAPKVGEKVTCVALVQNSGLGKTLAPVYIKVGSSITYVAASLSPGQISSVSLPTPFVFNTAGANLITLSLDPGFAISESNEYNNTYTKTFNVGIAGPASITVLTPNGGESWRSDQNNSIKWTSVGGDIVNAYVTFEDGATCHIGQTAASDGGITVPANYQCPNIPRSLVPGQYKATVILDFGKEGSGSDQGLAKDRSDNYFTITAGSVPVDLNSTCFNTLFSRDLVVGSSGNDVVALQKFLRDKGLLIIPNSSLGYFGADTRAAVAAYQVAVGVAPADGYFGPITRAAVYADCRAPMPVVQVGNTSASYTLTLGSDGNTTGASVTFTYKITNLGSSDIFFSKIPANAIVTSGSDTGTTIYSGPYVTTSPSSVVGDTGTAPSSGAYIVRAGETRNFTVSMAIDNSKGVSGIKILKITELRYGSSAASPTGQVITTGLEALTVTPNLAGGTSATLKVTSPNGGESYTQGQTIPLRWMFTNFTSSKAQLSLAYSGGGFYYISASTTNSGSYDWVVPEGPGTFPSNLKFKVLSYGSGPDAGKTLEDQSDNFFNILPANSSTTLMLSPSNMSGSYTLTTGGAQGNTTGAAVTFAVSLTNIGTRDLFVSKVPSKAIVTSTAGSVGSPAAGSSTITYVTASPSILAGDTGIAPTTGSYSIPAGSSRTLNWSGSLDNTNGTPGLRVFKIVRINYGENSVTPDGAYIGSNLDPLTVTPTLAGADSPAATTLKATTTVKPAEPKPASAVIKTDPTASLTANGEKRLTITPGEKITYKWSSTNGNAWTSSYTDSCTKKVNSWAANTANGQTIAAASASQVGCNYAITYKVGNSKTKKSASDTIVIQVVAKSSGASAGFANFFKNLFGY